MSIDAFSVEELRNEFLALQKIENGHFVSYFDAASGTQIAKSVVDAMTAYMKNGVGSSKGVHASAREAAAIIFRAREHVAQLVGANKSNVFFNGNMSTLTMLFSLYINNQWTGEKKNIVITDLNQQENVTPWKLLAEQNHIELRSIPVHMETNQLDISNMNEQITDETKLVALDFCSHITGVVHDIEKIVARAKEVGAIVIVNATHVVPFFSLHFEQMNVDVLLFSTHKMFAPHLGVAVVQDELMEQFTDKEWRPHAFLEPGAMNYEALVGLTEMVEFFSQLGEGSNIREKVLDAYNKISMYEAYLVNVLKKELQEIPFVHFVQGTEAVLHVPIIAFYMDEIDAKMISHYLGQDDAIHVDFGYFGLEDYVGKVTDSKEGLVRISIAPYNTVEEIHHLVHAIKKLENRF